MTFMFTVVNHTQLDPRLLTGCYLDDYADAWARRLMIPSARFGRRDAEPDADYRPRLLAMLESRLEG